MYLTLFLLTLKTKIKRQQLSGRKKKIIPGKAIGREERGRGGNGPLLLPHHSRRSAAELHRGGLPPDRRLRWARRATLPSPPCMQKVEVVLKLPKYI